MHSGLDVAVIVLGTGMFLLALSAAIVSLREHEMRAAIRLLIAGVLMALLYVLVGLFSFPYDAVIAIVLISLPIFAVILFFSPIQGRPSSIHENDIPAARIDERDIMFARWRLEPGTERFETYYQNHPDKRPLDDRFRSRPGLLAKGAKHYDPFLFAAVDASFSTVERFSPVVERSPAEEQTPVEAAAITTFIKQWAKHLGAMSIGVTKLKEYHLYSHVGRNEPYGEPIEREHTYAIALTVEMDKFMVDHAPYGPAAMETAQQYLQVGAIAIQIADFICRLGYPARAHIDGNYRVVCPLVARDAGLGEIGRMGLLMTPEMGPRVRLAVVTTDLPLIPDKRKRDHSVIDFCTRCLKCADACPSKAISFDDRCMIDGVKRWQINSEACFTYWCTVGTDCGLCMRVCPYSHPDNWMHNLVRAGIRRSAIARTIAIKMDDWLYGRKPSRRSLPDWMDFSSINHSL